jgi:hypothetical protein
MTMPGPVMYGYIKVPPDPAYLRLTLGRPRLVALDIHSRILRR